MSAVVRFFTNLFGNAGSFLVDSYNSVADFVSLCPPWLAIVLLGTLSVLVIRLVLK